MTTLSLPPQSTINQYIADGTQVHFDYHYLILLADDIDVYVTPSHQEPAKTDLITTGFSVTNMGHEDGGEVNFDKAPVANAIITLIRNVKPELHTAFKNARNFSGEALDNALQRLLLLIQQNTTQIESKVLRYLQNALMSNPTQNILPKLNDGDIWKRVGDSIINAHLEENPDTSTLRSELNSATQGSDGARLVGYYNDRLPRQETVQSALYRLEHEQVFQTGCVVMAIRSTLLGFVRMDDGTIGSRQSNASNRANDDTQALFLLLWTELNNDLAPVSGGRGASAEDDWEAHKTIQLVTSVGRVIANAAPTHAMGTQCGEETHTLDVAELPPHQHSYDGAIYSAYNPGGTSTFSANKVTKITSDGSDHGLQGQAHNIMQPTLFLNIFMKL